jgi:hypothetical protein
MKLLASGDGEHDFGWIVAGRCRPKAAPRRHALVVFVLRFNEDFIR